MPAASVDPAIGRSFGDRLGNHVHDAVPVVGLSELQDHLRVPDSHEVAVALDEPGDCQPAFEVDDFGVRAGGGFDLGGSAHRSDQAVPHGHGFRLGMVGIHGDHPAVEQDHVGGAADIGWLGAAPECRDRGGQKSETRQETHGIPPRDREA